MMNAESISAADGLVLTMLTMMILSFGTVALLLVCGLRNASRRNPLVDELIEEVAEIEKQKLPDSVTTEPEKSKEPWERDADWWKK
jgi:hypothetical protein